MMVNIENGGRRSYIETFSCVQKMLELYLKFDNAGVNACLGKMHENHTKFVSTYYLREIGYTFYPETRREQI